MAWGRKKLMSSFALMGFFIGTMAYLLFEWLAANSFFYIFSIPLTQILFSPWFISGIVGALISIIAIYAFAHFSSED